MTVANYLNRFLDPVTDAFTPEMARVVVNIRADAETQARINELRNKANDGTLTPDEAADYSGVCRSGRHHIDLSIKGT